MVFASRREQQLWFAAGLCIVLIYSSLYVARPIAEFLRDRNLLRLTVTLVFASTGVLIALRLLIVRPGWRLLATVGAIGLGYLLLLTLIPMAPEEALHFLEYGLVAALFYLALRERLSRRSAVEVDNESRLARLPPLASAIALTAIVGWIDEAIQAVLPNRVYDLRDVAFNVAAAVVCLGSIKLVEWVGDTEYPGPRGRSLD